ncbi:MAG: hypothetical protein AB7G11_04380 [Phycisphaerales bacterium]
MRRGQTRSDPANADGKGFSKQELLEGSGLSAKTFDTIRKAARVRGPSHGGLNWLFSIEDVHALIRRAESGTFTQRGAPAAKAWRVMLEDAGAATP